MDCWQCGAKAITGKALCEACLAIPRERPSASSITYKTENKIKFPLRALWLFPLGIFLIFLLFRSSDPIPFKGVKLKTVDGGTSELCQNKQACMAIFLAPWCGTCQSEVGFINELASVTRNTNLGLEVVVGWAEPAELREFGRSLQAKVFIDSENAFRSRLSFSSVPRWFSVNSQQQVIRSFFPSSYQGDNAREQLRDILENYAKELSPFLGR